MSGSAGPSAVRVTKLQTDEVDEGMATFVFENEDHTLGNALRYCLIKNRGVDFCGYSIPHPSEPKMNIRIQAAEGPDGAPVASADELLRQGMQDLGGMTKHIMDVFNQEVDTFEQNQ